MRVLLVEDDVGVAGALASGLRRHGWELVLASTGAEAVGRAPGVDLVLLDLGLPDIDGLEVCRTLRAGSDVPIIAVTARGDARSKVAGLRGGADDYVVKPFGFAELVARMEAVLRRSRPVIPVPQGPAAAPVQVGAVEIDLGTREVTVRGEPVRLTRKEFDLLALLAERPGAIRTRAEILERVWLTTWQGSSRTLDVHVASLRSKLNAPELVQTVRGVGYRLRDG